MATNLETLTVRLEGDAKKYNKTLDSAERDTRSWSGKMGGILTGVAMGVGAGLVGVAAKAVGAVTGFLGETIGAASDLGETVSKTNVLFDQSADRILEWSKTAATGFGQSQQQALDAATTFATFGRAAGLGGDDLVKFSTDFTELASDLASFNNTSPEQAITAIGAALRGETEPLRNYGVLLDDASMRQKALELGLISTTKEALTPQNKVLAAQALIYEQTTAAQGDFARTSDGLANKQRILSAQWEDFKSILGQGLLPIVTQFVGWLSDLATKAMPAVTSFVNEKLIPAINAISSGIQYLIGTYGPGIAAFVDGVKAKFGEWGDKLTAWYDDYGRPLVEAAQGAWDAIKAGWEGAADEMSTDMDTWRAEEEEDWYAWGQRVGASFAPLSDKLAEHLTTMSSDLAAWLNYWGNWEHLGGALAQAWEHVMTVMREEWQRTMDQFDRLRDLWNWLRGFGAGVVNGPAPQPPQPNFGPSFPTFGQGGQQADPYGYMYGASAAGMAPIYVTVPAAADAYQTGREVGRGVNDELRARGAV